MKKKDKQKKPNLKSIYIMTKINKIFLFLSLFNDNNILMYVLKHVIIFNS